MKKRALKIAALVVPLVMLAACTSALVTGGAAVMNIFDRPDVNLAEKNYAAADYLMQAGANFIKKSDDVKAVALQNVAEPQLSTRIGRIIAQQTGERLMQLGYRVDLTDVSANVENDFPYAAAPVDRQPDFVLSGTYLNAKSKVDVKLRLVNARTGAVVALFDYGLPMSHEVQRLTKPKPQIYRTTGQNVDQSGYWTEGGTISAMPKKDHGLNN